MFRSRFLCCWNAFVGCGIDCHCWIVGSDDRSTLAPPSPFQATALTQRLFQTLLLSTWLVLLGSSAAGMFLWVAALTAVSLADTRSINYHHNNAGVSILQAFHPPPTASTHHLRPYGCLGCRGTNALLRNPCICVSLSSKQRPRQATTTPQTSTWSLYGQECR